jgi:hypothetical protein
MAAAESAKAAGFDANVGKIDIAIDDIGDDIAHGMGAQMIRRRDHDEKVGTFGFEKLGGVVNADILPR